MKTRKWTEADLAELIGQQESARLEFKSGRLMDSKNEAVDTLSKEVSAFANSEGGTLIIGVRDERVGVNRVAASLDGVDATHAPQHWLQQVIESNVSPYLPGIRYQYVPLRDNLDGRVCIVITVPQGNTAYQAKDCRYYGRSEFEARALPDHEVQLRMHRGRTARLQLEVAESRPGWAVPDDMDEETFFHSLPPYEQHSVPEWSNVPDFVFLEGVWWRFRLGLRNTGEATARGFLLQLRWNAPQDIKLLKGDEVVGHDVSPCMEFESPQKFRIFPEQLRIFPDELWTLAAPTYELLRDSDVKLQWRLFTEDAPSVTDTLLLSEFTPASDES
jgi:hypothetical protein